MCQLVLIASLRPVSLCFFSSLANLLLQGTIVPPATPSAELSAKTFLGRGTSEDKPESPPKAASETGSEESGREEGARTRYKLLFQDEGVETNINH